MRLLLSIVALALTPAAAGAVVNGDDAQPGQFPWQVAVVGGGGFCGGSLLEADLVLTAAHCTDGLSASQIEVRAGSVDIDQAASHDVADVANHPQTVQSSETPRNDVAILRLAAPISGAQPIVPVGVEGTPADDEIWEPGDPVTVSGWGLDENETRPKILQSAAMDRWADGPLLGPDCRDAWGSEFFSEDMLCALGGSTPANVRDSCVGDSGGPLVASALPSPDPTDAADWKLVGVVSYGSASCEDPFVPGGYARVAGGAINSFLADTEPTFVARSTSAPTLTGEPRVGQTLTCNNGGWNGQATFSFQILRGQTLIATSSTYVVTTSDQGRTLRCRVVASNEGGSSSVLSNAVVIPAATGETPQPEPVPTPTPIPVAPTPIVPAPPAPPVVALDTTAPRSTLHGRVCRRRVCTISVVATDGTGSGVRTVLVTLSRKRGGRTITYRVRVRRLTSGDFELRTPRLPAGLYTLSVRAVDRSNNQQRRATQSRFRVRAAR